MLGWAWRRLEGIAGRSRESQGGTVGMDYGKEFGLRKEIWPPREGSGETQADPEQSQGDHRALALQHL